MLLEIDWQGAEQVRRQFAAAVGIFIMPPSLDELERRLRGRGSDSAEVIARRLSAAQDEMRHVREFEYVIINNELQEALSDLLSTVHASRLRLSQQQERHPELFTPLFQE
jgi:guanylate kinase